MKLCLNIGLSVCLGVVAFATEREAQACGGFFCDGGTPQPMPVDQTGEDVLFAVDGDSVEAHVRIQYMGEAENFAWVIPMMTVPTSFGVGSDALFEAVKNATVPTYGFDVQQDNCNRGQGGTATNADSSDGFGGLTGGGDGEFDDDDDGPDVDVLAEASVGAFDIVVLTGGSAQEVVDWLDENGYAQDPEAVPILDEYLAENHVFTAIKLQAGAAVEEVHPVVFNFDHSEPACRCG